MARQSELLTAALAATPGDVRRLVARAGDGVPELASALADLTEVESRTRALLETVNDDGAQPPAEPEVRAGGPVGPAEMALRFADERKATIAVLADLPVGGWARSVEHPEFGQIRVHALVRRLVDRDTGELARLTDLTATALSARGGGR